MYYGTIKKVDVANGPGVRVSLFVSGCTHHCRECFQPETWDFHYGEPFTEATEARILQELAPHYIEGFTVLGGEPFEPENQRELLPLLRKVRETYPKKNIWMYTGYSFEELTGQEKGTGRARCDATDEILSLIDVLVDGEFELERKDAGLQFRGSANQRLILVPASLQAGRVIWWEDRLPV
ncbi:MAG: anaerobic ribonucleoside-triphosphate reductase activating protein [Lachnospiraceae bacterium]|jgi:anaerobic ribonucleoside-triphosphate reductase activating protein|uniref:anaerobic ribonucleoside-triphosphate reductase activating protein n=1 Tax=Clostridium sp. (strain SY8519) TaxID=1042156 RepID=UPI0002172047|nr:anaerobic ribonucleoside-triphosphate reductase activating protein [Clostridium sp. SY8519]MCI1653854.1 anaerobic ribonucleoside-triphosphate reductase activating protein [Lachnospiraceae bacterium]MCI1656234.1 anaerobic ribonucleoside-triphosphate reductase activating protein [Lachnospiraceae bacterium]MCI2194716.1 anaerobic ribonucleoside-triphosphate reductase activating protein [Lachnospiraceae bacterium]BAK47323.1 organic radical activating enzyme [Clostridium sp. SY8519]